MSHAKQSVCQEKSADLSGQMLCDKEETSTFCHIHIEDAFPRPHRSPTARTHMLRAGELAPRERRQFMRGDCL
jgi:hypothetical protein